MAASAAGALQNVSREVASRKLIREGGAVPALVGLLFGDEMQAHIFATRAQEELDRGTEAWIRATEILAVTRPDTREMREWNRRERERRPNFRQLDRQALLQP